MDFFANFRVNLQLLRISKGYSAKELSLALCMNEKRITNFEQQHHPTAQELFDISKFFNVSAEDLIHKQAQIIFQ